MSFLGFGRKGLGQSGGFGRKGLADTAEDRVGGRIFGQRDNRSGENAPFHRYVSQLDGEKDLRRVYSHELYAPSKAMDCLSPEERGDLLADLVDRVGVYGGALSGSVEEKAAYSGFWNIWKHDIEVRKEHLGALLRHLLDNPSYRKESYLETQCGQLLRLIDSAIKQGAYLSSGDCEALAEMATAIRNGRKSYRKSDTKKMIARAERIEKLAGVEISATDFLMQRCEGAENPWAIAPGERPNAQFWADLFAEVTIALERIRNDTKGSARPAWMRDAQAFAAVWPACGDVVPRFGAWNGVDVPFAALREHNGKRTGFTDPEHYRRLPGTIALVQPHSRYDWSKDQIPGLDVLADLENPDWTALVEHMITQRRATKATAAWQKEALGLCRPLGLETVEARLHDWLALFHSPALDMAVYTEVCNGERFVAAIDRLEEAHPAWPAQHSGEVPALGRAVAMKVACGDAKDLCGALHSQLIRLDDHVYKNTRVTEGVLGLAKPSYKRLEGHSSYYSLMTSMRTSVENEEFLRGAVWLVALMPNRGRAIDALTRVAQTAATYLWTGDDGMRSKIVANAAIATLIAMGGSDIDQPILHLSKVVGNCTINPPLFKHLNGGAEE